MRFAHHGPVSRARDRVLVLDMTPMIDIVFQLLIFFLTTAQMAQLTRADIDLPRERGEDTRTREQAGMIVNVTETGEIIVGDKPISLEDLEAAAADLAAAPGGRAGGDVGAFRPLVRADRAAPAERLNAVLDALERAGVKAVRIATSPSK